MVAAQNTAPAAEMVFTMGLPGAGKSTAMARLGLTATHSVIDPDLIKATMPGYDPKRPEIGHEESTLAAERMFLAAVASGEGRWIVDGTGTNVEKMVRRIRQAQAMGFRCRLVFVRVSLATALARNAARERTVPASIVREKALDMATAFELVSGAADEITVIDND